MMRTSPAAPTACFRTQLGQAVSAAAKTMPWRDYACLRHEGIGTTTMAITIIGAITGITAAGK